VLQTVVLRADRLAQHEDAPLAAEPARSEGPRHSRCTLTRMLAHAAAGLYTCSSAVQP
jgi:hypothetical protein